MYLRTGNILTLHHNFSTIESRKGPQTSDAVMEDVGNNHAKEAHVKHEEGGSYLPSSLWQWETNEDEVQEEQPYDFSDDVALNDWNESDLANQILESTDAALQKSNHRLMLQGLLSAFVVVLCGFLVMLYNITSFVGFIIFSGSSLGN